MVEKWHCVFIKEVFCTGFIFHIQKEDAPFWSPANMHQKKMPPSGLRPTGTTSPLLITGKICQHFKMTSSHHNKMLQMKVNVSTHK